MGKENNKETASINDAISLTVSNYFGQSNAKDTVYSTSDGNVFENLGFATNHASTLIDKNVTPHKNANSIEMIEEDTEEDPESPSGIAATQNIQK